MQKKTRKQSTDYICDRTGKHGALAFSLFLSMMQDSHRFLSIDYAPAESYGMDPFISKAVAEPFSSYMVGKVYRFSTTHDTGHPGAARLLHCLAPPFRSLPTLTPPLNTPPPSHKTLAGKRFLVSYRPELTLLEYTLSWGTASGGQLQPNHKTRSTRRHVSTTGGMILPR